MITEMLKESVKIRIPAEDLRSQYDIELNWEKHKHKVIERLIHKRENAKRLSSNGLTQYSNQWLEK